MHRLLPSHLLPSFWCMGWSACSKQPQHNLHALTTICQSYHDFRSCPLFIMDLQEGSTDNMAYDSQLPMTYSKALCNKLACHKICLR